ncbi:hypothetical protein GCM10009747_17050 [Agromyces humatus]|uniref:Uncharacterized protein n=1 Tax=Agromyces humatus TaxID=279573 RepID=A0ABN2KMN9_9MICO
MKLRLFMIAEDEHRFVVSEIKGASYTKDKNGRIVPQPTQQLITPPASGTFTYVAIEAVTGAYVVTFSASPADTHTIGSSLLQPVNNPGLPGEPGIRPTPQNAGSPLPADSPPVLVGAGWLDNGFVVVRSQFWRKSDDSTSLPGCSSLNVTTSQLNGLTTSSSEMGVTATQVGATASAGWGPISASLSASMSRSSSTSSEVTITEETEATLVRELRNETTAGEIVLFWQLIDQYAIQAPGFTLKAMIETAIPPSIPVAYDTSGGTFPPSGAAPCIEPTPNGSTRKESTDAAGATFADAPGAASADASSATPPAEPAPIVVTVSNLLSLAVDAFAVSTVDGVTVVRFIETVEPGGGTKVLVSEPTIRLAVHTSGAIIVEDYASKATLTAAPWTLAAPNTVPPPPVASAAQPLPTDTAPWLVGIGRFPTPKDAKVVVTFTREQFWRKTPDSFSLPPGARLEKLLRQSSGVSSSSSKSEEATKEIGFDISAGWGPFSASASASMSETSQRTDTVSVREESTSTVVQTFTNASTKPVVVNFWQLIDRISVRKNDKIVASVDNGNLPLVPHTLQLGADDAWW